MSISQLLTTGFIQAFGLSAFMMIAFAISMIRRLRHEDYVDSSVQESKHSI
jgi:hypothetical protein